MNRNNRTYHRPLGILVVLFLVMANTAFAQVSIVTDTANIKIGEEVIYEIRVETDSIIPVVFPEGQTFLPLEVIENYPTDTSFQQNKYNLIKKYGLTQFDSGSYYIPKQRVLINNLPFTTDSILIEVADVTVDTTTQKMYDIKTAIQVPSPPSKLLRNILWVLLILIVLAALVYAIVWKKKKIEEAKKQLPPYEEALFALQSLDSSELLKNQKIKDYYSSLTEIVKRYLDREVDEMALESTTNELIERLILLKDSGKLVDYDTETLQNLEAVLRRADLIKFAKMQTETGQAQADRGAIEAIINKTHASIPEPTEEELLRDELYRKEQERKRKLKKQKVIAGFVAGILLMSLLIASLTLGFSTVKETIFGNETKELLDGEWVKSEYGSPAIIVETPTILVRTEIDLPEGFEDIIASSETFMYGSLLGKFSIVLNITRYNQPIEADLETVLEGSIVGLEQEGATNIIIKHESFETSKGIKGLRAFGSFDYKPLNSKVIQGKIEYEVLIFSQKGAVHQIYVTYDPGDEYAKNIIDRIINSAELEVLRNRR